MIQYHCIRKTILSGDGLSVWIYYIISLILGIIIITYTFLTTKSFLNFKFDKYSQKFNFKYYL